MTLLQLRALCQVVDSGLNLSRSAQALHTSQPAITRMVRSLEQELGTELLVRAATRICGLTSQGEKIVARARQILNDVGDLSSIARDEIEPVTGEMKVGTTHAYACYGMVNIVKKFALRHPRVDLNLCQGTQLEIIQWVSNGQIDLGISATPAKVPANVLTLDAYPIERCLIAPAHHPILSVKRITLKDIARYPIVAHDENNESGSVMREKMARAGLTPQIIVNAKDSDVVLRYVAAGIGIALLPKSVFELEQHGGIRARDMPNIFPPTMARISLRKNAYLRNFVYDLIGMIAPQWAKAEIDLLKNQKK